MFSGHCPVFVMQEHLQITFIGNAMIPKCVSTIILNQLGIIDKHCIYYKMHVKFMPISLYMFN